MRRVLVLCSAVLSTSFAGCDTFGGMDPETTVSGIVVDGTTGEPIAGIDVFIASGYAWGAFDVEDDDRTSADGRFDLVAPSSEFRHIWPTVYANQTSYGARYVFNSQYQSYSTAGVGYQIEPGSTKELRVELCPLDVSTGRCLPQAAEPTAAGRPGA